MGGNTFASGLRHRTHTPSPILVYVDLMVFAIRNGSLRLHAMNHATGRSICGRYVPPQQITRHAHMVSCRICDNRIHQAELDLAQLFEAVGPELLEQILARTGVFPPNAENATA